MLGKNRRFKIEKQFKDKDKKIIKIKDVVTDYSSSYKQNLQEVDISAYRTTVDCDDNYRDVGILSFSIVEQSEETGRRRAACGFSMTIDEVEKAVDLLKTFLKETKDVSSK